MLFQRVSGHRQTNTQTVPLLIKFGSVTDSQNFFCKIFNIHLLVTDRHLSCVTDRQKLCDGHTH